MKRSKINTLLLILLLVLPCSVSAQVTKIKLQEAITMALDNSKILKADSLSIAIAESRYLKSIEGKIPELSLSSSYMRISDNITPFTVAFPQGNVVLNPQILNQSFNSVQARQVLWGGGKIRNSSKILKLEPEALAMEKANNEENLKYDVTSIYYNLFVAKRTKDIIESNIVLLQSQQKDIENLVVQGILIENDRLKVDLSITNLSTTLSEVNNLIDFLKSNLAIITGSDFPSIDIDDNLPELDHKALSISEFTKSVLANRSDLKALTLRQEQSKVGTAVARANYFPTVSGIFSYNYDQPNVRVFPNQETFTGTWFAGISLSWNLTTLYTNKFAVRESKFAYEKWESTIAAAKEGIEIEVNKNYIDYLTATEKIQLADKALRQAKENFRVEQERYKANAITTTDYLSANTALVNAEINLYTARANADLAYHKLTKSLN